MLDPELTPAQRERVQSYLEATERRLGRSQFAGAVGFGLRFQSNANGGSETGLATSSLGTVLLPSSLRQRSDINAFLNGDVVHTYDLDLQRPAVIETHAAGYATRQTSPDFYNFLGMTLHTGVRFAVAPETMPSLSLYPYVLTDLVLLNDSFYNFSGGNGLEVSVNPTKALNVSLIGEFKGAHYDEARRVPGSSALSGNQELVLLRATYRATPELELLTQTGGTFVNTKTAFETYVGFEATLGASFAYSAPAVFGGSTWSLLGSATYLRRQSTPAQTSPST